MDLPSSCNSSICERQIQSPHRGICPDGWHIPSQADWGVMTEGKKLKAASGWNNRSDGTSGNGTDDYGFSALPGGDGGGSSFYSVGNRGLWWSASEDGGPGGSLIAKDRDMRYDHDDADLNYKSKTNLFSVRCLQD